MSKTIEDRAYSNVSYRSPDFTSYELKPEDKGNLRKAYLIRNGDMKTNQELQKALIELIKISRNAKVKECTILFYETIVSRLAELDSNTASRSDGMTSKEQDIYKELRDHMWAGVLTGMKREVISQYSHTKFMEDKKCKIKITIQFLHIPQFVVDEKHIDGETVISRQKGETLTFMRETGELINLGREAKSERDIVLASTHFISRQHFSLIVLPTGRGCYAILRDNGSLRGSRLMIESGREHEVPFAAMIAELSVNKNFTFSDTSWNDIEINLKIELLD